MTTETDASAAPGVTGDNTADDATITLNTDAPASPPPVAAKAEPTAEELAAEETRRAALTDDQRQAEDDQKAADKAAAEAAKNKAPEKYEAFKMPDGITLVPEVVAEFEGVAKKHNLSQEAAQDFADIGSKLTQQWVQKQNDAVIAAQQQWQADSIADKEFGGEKVKENVALAEAAIKAFTTPEYRKLLKDSGLGNHPEVIRTFFRIGKQIQPDKTVLAPGASSGARDETPEARASRLYPTSAKAA